MSTKLELLAIYRTAINRVQFAYACLVLWSYPDAPVIFEAMHAEMSDDLKPFPAVVVSDEIGLFSVFSLLLDVSWVGLCIFGCFRLWQDLATRAGWV